MIRVHSFLGLKRRYVSRVQAGPFSSVYRRLTGKDVVFEFPVQPRKSRLIGWTLGNL